MNINESVDVRLGCDGAIFHNLNLEFLPNTITISYVDLDGLFNFINSGDGKVIVNAALSDTIKVIIFPTDSLCISVEQYHTLCDNLDFISNKNVTFYQSWYNEYLNFKPYCGSHIHKALSSFIFRNENKTIDLTKKEKHFLALNNRWSLSREELYDFYTNLEQPDKDKLHSSFNFKDIYLDGIKETEDLYGDNIIKFYDDSLVEIITESHYDSITEKSYKPLIAGIPFIYWRVDDNYKVKDNYSDQMSYFKLLDIDVNYFNINYNNSGNIKSKVTEILSLSKEELIEKYKVAFDKAQQNKIKIINYLSEIENDFK